MGSIQKNLKELLESLIVDDYSKASDYLAKVVEEKVKERVRVASLKPLFEKKSNKKSKGKGKSKNKTLKEGPESHDVLDLRREIFNDLATTALHNLQDYHSGQFSALYKVSSSGKIGKDELLQLASELEEASQIAAKNGDVDKGTGEPLSDAFVALSQEVRKLNDRYNPEPELPIGEEPLA